MSARRRQIEIGKARGRRIVVDLGREIDDARQSAGLSYAELGRTIGRSGDQVARICRGESPNVSMIRLAMLLSALGLDVSARAYPSGSPVRDAAHLALLRRLRARLAPSLRWRLEAPVVSGARIQPSFPKDHRAWDAVIEGAGWSIAVEAETRLHDVQALLRRIALKRRDGSVDLVVLLVNQTTHNRAVLGQEGSEIEAQFAGSARRTLSCLRSGTLPSADALLVM